MQQEYTAVLNKKSLTSLIISVLIIASLFLSAYTRAFAAEVNPTLPVQNHASLTTLNTQEDMSNGETHIIRSGNSVTLIDVSPEIEPLIVYLKERSITTIDRVIVSHLHKDHFGGIYRLPEAGITIKEVIYNDVRDDHVAHDCCSPEGEIDEFFNFFEWNPEIQLTQIKSNQTFPISENVELKTIYAGSADLGGDIHDSNIIMKLMHPSGCILFTGDMDEEMGEMLVEYGFDIQCSVMKAPHHGIRGMPNKAFFHSVGAKSFIIPVHYDYWEKDRPDSPIKQYIAESGAAFHITGKDGSYATLLN